MLLCFLRDWLVHGFECIVFLWDVTLLLLLIAFYLKRRICGGKVFLTDKKKFKFLILLCRLYIQQSRVYLVI